MSDVFHSQFSLVHCYVVFLTGKFSLLSFYQNLIRLKRWTNGRQRHTTGGKMKTTSHDDKPISLGEADGAEAPGGHQPTPHPESADRCSVVWKSNGKDFWTRVFSRDMPIEMMSIFSIQRHKAAHHTLHTHTHSPKREKEKWTTMSATAVVVVASCDSMILVWINRTPHNHNLKMFS